MGEVRGGYVAGGLEAMLYRQQLAASRARAAAEDEAREAANATAPGFVYVADLDAYLSTDLAAMYQRAEPELANGAAYGLGQADAPDLVNHPPHYTAGGIECIDAIQAALTPEEFRGYCKGAALKYVWRERHKGGAESLAKAGWYLNRLAEVA